MFVVDFDLYSLMDLKAINIVFIVSNKIPQNILMGLNKIPHNIFVALEKTLYPVKK